MEKWGIWRFGDLRKSGEMCGGDLGELGSGTGAGGARPKLYSTNKKRYRGKKYGGKEKSDSRKDGRKERLKKIWG